MFLMFLRLLLNLTLEEEVVSYSSSHWTIARELYEELACSVRNLTICAYMSHFLA